MALALGDIIKPFKAMDLDEVNKQVAVLKQRFINDITAIGNQCVEPIEIVIEQRKENVFLGMLNATLLTW